MWHELKLKMEKSQVEKRFEEFNEELDALSKRNNREIG